MATSRAASPLAAYVLHQYDWSESSLILEVFTRHYGRIALVAKGAKRPSSSFRPVLLPLQELQVSFGGDAEIKTLRSAEWVGGHVMPTGAALLSGLYLNELLMRLLPREEGKGRIAAVEILLNTPLVSDLIFKGEVAEIKDLMRRSRELGMQTFDQALFDLFEAGEVSMEDALRNADSVNDLRLQFKLNSQRARRRDLSEGTEHLTIV